MESVCAYSSCGGLGSLQRGEHLQACRCAGLSVGSLPVGLAASRIKHTIAVGVLEVIRQPIAVVVSGHAIGRGHVMEPDIDERVGLLGLVHQHGVVVQTGGIGGAAARVDE